MKKKTIQKNEYKNATVFKMKNKRMAIVSIDEEIEIQTKVLTDDLAPRSLHKVSKGKIVSTTIKFSQEGAVCLLVGLLDRLEKDGVTFNIEAYEKAKSRKV
jgi:hypothetical protein